MKGFIVVSLTAAVVILALAAFLWAVPVKAGECAKASWYGEESGNRTANGEKFTGNAMTAAHKTLPFGTKLRVTLNGKSVVVRINDRGPWVRGRELDLSRAAAARLGMVQKGVARVCWTRVR